MSRLIMEMMMGVRSPSKSRNPLRNAAAVFRHLPSSDDDVFKSCLYDEWRLIRP